MALTLKQIRYFIAAAETGKISSAAIDLNISASSITEAVKELEAEMKVSLLIRSKNGVNLTYEGYRFLQYAKNILSSVDDARYGMTQSGTDFSGKLDIALTITVAGYFISKPLARFRRTFPNIEITLHEHSRKIVEKKIEHDQIDLAVVLTSNISAGADFSYLTLFTSHRRLWLPSDHPLNEVASPTLEEISREPYIQLTIDEAAQTTQNYWKNHKLKPNVIYSSESVEAIRSLVGSGAGVTILSDMVHRPWSLEGLPVATKPVRETIPTMDTGIIWKRNRSLSQSAKAFIDFCRMEYTSGRRR